ncbi:MAG: hypothetical protein AAF555_12005 [Verrucomicrobiota bacterium]
MTDTIQYRGATIAIAEVKAQQEARAAWAQQHEALHAKYRGADYDIDFSAAYTPKEAHEVEVSYRGEVGKVNL